MTLQLNSHVITVAILNENLQHISYDDIDFSLKSIFVHDFNAQLRISTKLKDTTVFISMTVWKPLYTTLLVFIQECLVSHLFFISVCTPQCLHHVTVGHDNVFDTNTPVKH